MAATFPGDRFVSLSDQTGLTVKITVDERLNMVGSGDIKWKNGATKEESDTQWVSIEDPLFRNWMVSRYQMGYLFYLESQQQTLDAEVVGED